MKEPNLLWLLDLDLEKAIDIHLETIESACHKIHDGALEEGLYEVMRACKEIGSCVAAENDRKRRLIMEFLKTTNMGDGTPLSAQEFYLARALDLIDLDCDGQSEYHRYRASAGPGAKAE